jgi:hypothetical protein
MKRLISVFLSVILTITLSAGVSASEMFTTADALTVLRAAAGLITLTAEQTAKYDMDGDGEITTTDAMMILRGIAGVNEQLTVDNGQLTINKSLSADADMQIRENYAAFMMYQFWGHPITADELTVYRYFGTFGGREAVVIYPKDWAMTDDMLYIDIAGYRITLESGSLSLVVHDNGKFVPIREAYEQGLLIDEDIAFIAG